MESDRCGRLRLIEVLVIILVVGFLLALLLPSVGPREAGPRAWCMNNQSQFGKALLNYEAAHKRFPGYANRIAKRPDGTWLVGSWVVSIFGYLDRADLEDEWGHGNPVAVGLGFTTCPEHQLKASVRRTEPLLDYVINCGLPGDSDTEATGVFHNHNTDGKPVCVSIPYIVKHDGAQNTLMLSENLQGGLWTDTEEANVGMVWFREPDECSGINECKDVGQRPQDIRYARPSSNHPGGVTRRRRWLRVKRFAGTTLKDRSRCCSAPPPPESRPNRQGFGVETPSKVGGRLTVDPPPSKLIGL
jgi:hypothetical protein